MLRTALIAQLIQPLRRSDTIAVYAPHRIAVILEDVASIIGSQIAVGRMMEMGRPPITIAGRTLTPVIKAGLAVSAPPRMKPAALVEHALARAQKREGSTFVSYDANY